MELAGPVIGMPFSLEGFAFFTEAIFLGIYLYGWDRISPRAHLAAGIIVAFSGVVSGVFVVMANAWMNAPTGFTFVDGRFTDIDPIAAMGSSAAFQQVLHMTLAAYAATGLGVAGIHAFLLRRDPLNAFHRRALMIGLMVGAPAALLQPLSGDISARNVAEHQPAKLAAMEALFETRDRAPLLIGGLPDMESRTTRWGIEIPAGLSLLIGHDPATVVTGLDSFPRADWPHVPTVHMAFQIMVGLGSLMALVSLWALFKLFRGHDLAADRRFLLLTALTAPMGFIAIEAGWTVTEVGRQPWIIYNVMRTSEAVTPMPGLVYTFLGFTALYCFLGVVVAWLLYSQIIRSPREREWHRVYSPKPRHST
jgi:cytochrome d ubiquinol oxidase subunit I